jgi:hypothetical protein
MYKKILILIALCIGSQMVWPQGPIVEMTTEKWVEDLQYFEATLLKKHVKPFHTVSQEKFQEAIKLLEDDILKLSNDQIMIEFVKLAAMIRDGHTQVELEIQERYPIGLYSYHGKLYVISTSKEYSNILGYELIKVNNTPIENAIDMVTPLIDRDNEMEIPRQAPGLLSLPVVLQTTGIVSDPEKATFHFKHQNGEIKKVELTAYKSNESPEYVRANNLPEDQKPLYLQKSGTDYWYQYLPENKVVYFNFDRVNNQKGRPRIKKFSKEMIAFIQDNDVDKLVIDLRNNPGGNYHKGEHLVDAIMELDKINRKGKLFVITSRNTGSAATVLAAQFKTTTAATIVGEVSRANPNFTYNSENFQLPNSKLNVGYTESLHKPFPTIGDRVEVDVKIENSFEDYLNGRDSVLETIIDYQ